MNRRGFFGWLAGMFGASVVRGEQADVRPWLTGREQDPFDEYAAWESWMHENAASGSSFGNPRWFHDMSGTDQVHLYWLFTRGRA